MLNIDKLFIGAKYLTNKEQNNQSNRQAGRYAIVLYLSLKRCLHDQFKKKRLHPRLSESSKCDLKKKGFGPKNKPR